MKNTLNAIALAIPLAVALPAVASEPNPEVRVIVSESIRSMRYDARQSHLALRLTDGTEYRFGSVPKTAYHAFREAKNRGAWFNLRIRKVYPCLEIRYPRGGVEHDPHRYECTRHRYR